MDKIGKLIEIINNSKYIVFFGGAGVSTASGIPDFRSQNGLFNEDYIYPPEVILSHTFFMSNPKEFYKFYFDKMIYLDSKCNKCHTKLKELEDKGILKAIITQNIDGLHEKAGSNNVYNLHGTIYKNHCIKCNKSYSLDYMIKNKDNLICSCGGTIKPDVVLYEEMLDEKTLNDSVDHIKKADTLIIGGTSLNVYPAASLINYFNGKNIILINKTKTPYDNYATLVINDDINKVFDKIK